MALTISETGNGWESDPFLWEAIRIKWKLKTRLSGVMKRLGKKYERK